MTKTNYARQVRESYPTLCLIGARIAVLAALGALSLLPSLA